MFWTLVLVSEILGLVIGEAKIGGLVQCAKELRFFVVFRDEFFGFGGINRRKSQYSASSRSEFGSPVSYSRVTVSDLGEERKVISNPNLIVHSVKKKKHFFLVWFRLLLNFDPALKLIAERRRAFMED